jgi:hypothetical protein
MTSGPPGVTVTYVNPIQGTHDITVTGTFPASQGVLLVSYASGQSTDPNEFIAATITSWTATQIDFTVLTVDSALNPWNEDFSFVIIGN